jgi:GNAT superfamily N-acetyltransferase
VISYQTAQDPESLFEDVYAVYRDVFTEPPHSQDEHQLRDFVTGYPSHTRAPGFKLETAHINNQLVGFGYGSAKPAGWWWGYGDTEPADEILNVPKFAVFEWAVVRSQRGQGVGRQILARLLAERPEPWATLWSHPASDAYRIYLRTGWTRVATCQRPGWPAMAAMVLRLPGSRGHREAPARRFSIHP